MNHHHVDQTVVVWCPKIDTLYALAYLDIEEVLQFVNRNVQQAMNARRIVHVLILNVLTPALVHAE